MRRAGYLLPAALAACLALGAIALFLSGPLTTRAVQNPRISLDMDPAGNSYDAATNTMTVGTVDGCLASPQANPSTHTHTAQIVVENIEDLVGWQARLNYNGDEMRPASVDFDPFLDTTTRQEVSFVNLPKDGGVSGHRHITAALAILPAAPGPQSSLIGSVYDRTQDAPISADTPAKNPPDDTSYSAPNGGVLAALGLEVPGDQSGRTLFMQLDNDNPNPPGSKFVVFNGTGTDDIDLAGDQLASGYHSEGAEVCGPVETPKDLFADLRLTEVTLNAPSAVSDAQPFDIQVVATVENQGPDETNAFFLLTFYSPVGCSGPQDIYMGSITMQPLSVATLEHSASFACYTAAGPTRSATFRAVVDASLNAHDSDMSNNLRSGQVSVVVIGTSPVPTPSPEPGIIQDPDRPTSVPPDTVPAGGTSPSDDAPAIAAAPPATQANIQTPAVAVLAATLPQTGAQGGEGQPDWLLLLVAGGAFGVTVAAAIATRRLLSHRR